MTKKTFYESVNIVKEKFLLMADEINNAMGTALTPQDIANGFLMVANEKMAMAIKEISVSKGFDVRDYTLVCFGGAGGQHACTIASLLGIERVVFHPLSSVMSAYGIGLSKPAWKATRTILRPYNNKLHKELSCLFEEMEEQLLSKRQRHDNTCISKREIDLRPKGTETFLTLGYGNFDEIIETFKGQYKRLFGLGPEDTTLEVFNNLFMGIASEMGSHSKTLHTL